MNAVAAVDIQERVLATLGKPSSRFSRCGVLILEEAYRWWRRYETLPTCEGTPCPRPRGGHALHRRQPALSEMLDSAPWETYQVFSTFFQSLLNKES